MMRALILDDDQIFIEVSRSCLQALGMMDIQATTDATEASDIIHNEEIDVLLLDLNMPDHDGLAFLRDLSQIGYKGGIIIVSGEKANILSSSKHIAERLGLNICASLSKPLKVEALQRALQCAKVFKAENSLHQPTAQLVVSGGLKPVLWYQPQVNIHTGELVGVEALLRGIDENNSIFGPSVVLQNYRDVEARFDFTVELFDLFCQDVKSIRAEGHNVRASFNVDAAVLETSGFAEAFSEKVKTYELDPKMIVIELIESYLPQDEVRLLEVIARLSMAGFELSMDDFSSGASSFELLRAGAFSEIKLDMGLVESSASSAASAKFIYNAVSMAESLDTRIIAEGIETQDDFDRLSAMGVYEMQGFYFAKPADKNKLKHNYMLADEDMSAVS